MVRLTHTHIVNPTQTSVTHAIHAAQPARALEFARTRLAPHVSQQPTLLEAYKSMTAGLLMPDAGARFGIALAELRRGVQGAVENKGGERGPPLEALMESLLEYHRRWFVLQHSYDRCVWRGGGTGLVWPTNDNKRDAPATNAARRTAPPMQVFRRPGRTVPRS